MTFTPIAGLIDEHCDLMGKDTLDPDALRLHGLATTTQASRQEFDRFVAEYAAAIAAPVSTESRNSALDGIVDRMAANPVNVTLVPADWPVPEGAGLRVVPIHPVPLFPWYAAWRTGTPHALVPLLLRAAHASDDEPNPTGGEHWLPAGVRSPKATALGEQR